MGALLTSTVRAPLTGIVLMIELTGKYDYMLPLLACCFVAYGIAEAMNNVPITVPSGCCRGLSFVLIRHLVGKRSILVRGFSWPLTAACKAH